MAIHGARDFSDVIAQLIDTDIGDAPFRMPTETFSLPQNRVASALNRLRYEAAPILPFPGICRENHAWRHFPAIGGKACDARPKLLELLEDSHD